MTQLPVTKFSHIVVRVSDIERSLKWYEENFGFKTVFDVALEGEEYETIANLPTGSTARNVGGLVGDKVVELTQKSSPEPTPIDGTQLGISAFTVQVTSADEAYAIAQRNGVQIISPPVAIMGWRNFFIADPDGIRIEIAEPPPEGDGLDAFR
jgi:catechol 2,3-dioxygenase-like lactoylglutathione lyase family enzyme